MLKALKTNLNNNWSTYRSMIWRLVRGAFATAFAQTMFIACGPLFAQGAIVECVVQGYQQWTDPKQAAVTLGIALASGFLMALGVGVRDFFGDEDKGKGAINKLIV